MKKLRLIGQYDIMERLVMAGLAKDLDANPEFRSMLGPNRQQIFF